MTHPQQFFCIQPLKQFLPQYFEGCKVLEIGSLNLNGSILRDSGEAGDQVDRHLGLQDRAPPRSPARGPALQVA